MTGSIITCCRDRRSVTMTMRNEPRSAARGRSLSVTRGSTDPCPGAPVKMSVSGMKKQLHKASQLLNERLMGAEGTKMDDDFLKMEKAVVAFQSLLAELLTKTTEFLQPNPADRARLNLLTTVSRLRGQSRALSYPQTESMLGDCMLHYGQELGEASEFGGALSGVGEALQQVASARDSLDASVRSSFIDPLQDLQSTELKDIRFQLKKLNGRRLDFDYKKRRRGNVPAEDVGHAWDKVLVSKELVERSMFVLLQEDVDQLGRLAALTAALLDFHRDAHRILLSLHGNLQARLTEASNKPERRFRTRKIQIRRDQDSSMAPPTSGLDTPTNRHRTTTRPADARLVLDQPCCRAIYSFHPNQEEELDFSEGDIIILTNQVDAHWYEGTLGGQTGLFPISYVDVLVPLPLP